MYWIPAFFIFLEIILILSLDNLVRYGNIKFLYEKYKNSELKEYANLHFHGIAIVNSIFAITLIGEIIYFIVALFYPIWIISVVFLLHFLFLQIRAKLKKDISIEKRIKLAKLKGFETKDEKFSRLLKLNELKNSEIKTNQWMMYIYPVVRIIIFGSIIILHYNYNLL